MATGCSQDAPVLRRLLPGDAILAFGDSLTFGTGANADESYPAVLGDLINRKVVRSGVPGELSNAGLARLPDVLDKVKPKLVLLCHGGNDLLRKRSLGAAASNVRQMIALSREHGAEVVLFGVPRPALILSPAEFYDGIAQELQIPYLRDSISDILGDAELKADAAHPNAAGYRRLAAEVKGLLSEAGAV